MGNPLPVTLSQECRKATQILNDFVDPVNGLDRVLPLSVLRKAKGFAIFSVFRIGFVLSARAGSGIVIVKTDEGAWSAPAAIGIGGLGGGFNVGAEVTDFLIVLNSRSAVRSFMATGSLQLGGNLSVAVGPLGRSAEASGSVNSSGNMAAMFSYSKSKGLYGGVSVEGTVLIDREDANGKAYGRSGHTAKQILSGSVDVPPFAQELIGTIERFTLAHTPVGDLDSSNPYEDEEYFRYGDTGRRGTTRRDRRDSRDSDRSLDARDARDRDVSRSGMSWSERKEQYQSTGPTRRSPASFAKGRRTSQLLEDDFDRMGISDSNTRSQQNEPRRSSESWTEADRRKRNEAETRNMGAYAFGSPASSITNAPPRTGSGASVRKRPGIRQRSSSIASNLSFGSFGKKKTDRSGSTPIPDYDDGGAGGGGLGEFGAGGKDSNKLDSLDPLDRELQSGSITSRTYTATAGRRPSHTAKSPSYAGRQSPFATAADPRAASTSSSPFNRHRTNSSLSVTGRQGWSTFGSSNTGSGGRDDDDDDDVFGGGPSSTAAPSAGDPFADLAGGSWTGNGNGGSTRWEGGYSGSNMRGTSTLGATNVPRPAASSPLSSFGGGSGGGGALGSSQWKRTTPTIAESHADFGDLIGSDDYPSSSRGGGAAGYASTSTDDGVNVGLGSSYSVGVGGGGGGEEEAPAVLERVVALYDFEAQEEGDLSFSRGQVIAVTRRTKTRQDWWQGRVEAGVSASRIGIFPASYTESV